MSLEQVKIKVEELERTTTSVLTAIGDNAKATRENTAIVNDMLISMRERDVRDEYRIKEIKDISERVDINTHSIAEYKERHRDTMTKVEQGLAWRKSFWTSVNSSWGKMAGIIILVAIASALGLDLNKLIGK